MKCYIVVGNAYSKEEGAKTYCDLEVSLIIKVFKNRTDAINYIFDACPSAKCYCNDVFGEHFVVEPTEYWAWRNVYYIVEKEIVE